MKNFFSFFILAIIVTLSGCQKDRLTCKITSPYNGQEVLINKELVVRVEVEATKSNLANVVVSYENMLSSSLPPYNVVLTSEPYTVTIPALSLLLGKSTIKAVATNIDGIQAESSVTVNVVDTIIPNEIESPDFVTFANGNFPAGWKTYTWEIDNIGYDDGYSLKSANPLATVYTKKTMHAPSYIQFYTKGDKIDLYINDVKADALIREPAGSWEKWVYPVDSGKHEFRWQTEGALKYLDAITFSIY